MSEQPTTSDRGFKHMDPIPSAYGGHISAYESSAAAGPHIWVKIQSPQSFVDVARKDAPGSIPDGMTEGTAHLTLADATRLRDQLTYLIEHHYQTEGS